MFDFDLTLADSSEAILMCFKHTLAEFGYPIPDDSVIFNTIGLTLAEAFDILTGVENNPKREEMRKVYVKKADVVMVRHTYFYDNVLAILQTLQNAGVKVGILSTKYRYRIEDTFAQQAGSFPYDEIIGGEDVENAKPSPDGLELMVERLGVDKADILYVGDSYIDAQTAQNAGVDFAGVLTGSTTREDFSKYPHIFLGKDLLEVFLQ